MPSSGEALPRISFSRGTLLLEPFAADVVKGVRGSGSWMWDPRVAAWRCDAIDYPSLRESLQSGALRFDDKVPGWQTVRWPGIDLPRLRAEQNQAVNAWKQAKRGVVVMPTGTG